MKARLLSALFASSLLASASAQGPLITEFKAVNTGPLLDEDSETSDWIELFNAAPTNINLAGWFLTDSRAVPALWAFPETHLPPGGFLIVFASGKNRRVPGSPLHTSFTLAGEGDYQALVQPDGVTVEQEFSSAFPPQHWLYSYGLPMGENPGPITRTNIPTFLPPTPGSINSSVSASLPLALTELMYHPAAPAPGSSWSADDFEFIELMNVGTDAINLTNAAFSDGIDFTFPHLILPPGQRVVVVANRDAFQYRHGPEPVIAGEFTGSLSDSGERLALHGWNGAPIFDFSYRDAWQPATDGHGFSLVPVAEPAPPVLLGLRSQWRSSGQLGGSPGAADLPASIPPIFVNEALTRPEAPFEDAIELFNPNSFDVDISGWFLTDDFDEPKKYHLPPGAFLPAGGFLALDEHAFNSSNKDPTAGGFGLSDFGEEIYLFSGDTSGNLTGYAHGFSFGVAGTNVTLGRHVTSEGEEHFVAQSAVTFLETNVGPLIGPVVLSEIHYHAPDLGQGSRRFEFIELRNITDQPVSLYDPLFPTNGWRLGDFESNSFFYAFPAGAVITAHGYVLVAGFSPADTTMFQSFTNANHLTPGTPIYGPWFGQLDNNGRRIELLRPDPPEPLFVPYIVVDSVRYSDRWPWPDAADGLGFSLHRINERGFADDPAHWAAGAVTPGLPGGLPPAIQRQPEDRFLAIGADATFDATAVGTIPISYQWFFNALAVPGATGSVLRLTNVQTAEGGAYTCLITNAAGQVLSRAATLALADTNRPTLVVSTPSAAQQRVSAASSFTLAGTAFDDTQLAAVFVQPGNGSLLQATGATDWTLSLNLVPGLNTVRCFATDWAGNHSITNTVFILSEPNPARLGLTTSGAGTVSGATNGQLLSIGRRYSLLAKPTAGHDFSHWSDWEAGIVSTNRAFSFVMSSNRTFTARFTSHPFLSFAGGYNGLFADPANPAHLNAGRFNLNVTTRGAYTGRLGYRGVSHVLRGRLDGEHSATQLINRPGTNDLLVNLQLIPGSAQISGSVMEARFASALSGHRAGFSAGSAATNFAGRYSITFNAVIAATNATGTGTMSVSAGGRTLLRGRLPDRTPVAREILAGDDGRLPFYQSLYGNAGSAFGWLSFTNTIPDPFRGPLLWTRTGARGFTNSVQVLGHR